MEEDIHRYAGNEIEATYDVNRCIHVQAYVEGLPDVRPRRPPLERTPLRNREPRATDRNEERRRIDQVFTRRAAG